MMNKDSVKGYAILGILFALVSAVVFAVPTAKTPAFWIAYGFTVVAFATQPFIWKSALGREESLKSNIGKNTLKKRNNMMHERWQLMLKLQI